MSNYRDLMRGILIGACSLLLLAVVASAQTSQPATGARGTDGAGARGGRRGGAAGAGNVGQRGGAAVARGMSPEERGVVEAWAREHMPNLTRLLDDTARYNPKRARLISLANNQMHLLEQAKDDPALAEKVKQNIQAQDAILKLAIELDGAVPADQPALRQQIRQSMRQYIADLLDERAKRLEMAKQKMQQEEDRLTQDRSNMEQIVTNRLRNLGVDAPAGADGTEPKSAPSLTPAAPINAMDAGADPK